MNNKPAFPIVYPDDTVNPGMTLRDYFAAKAIEGKCWEIYSNGDCHAGEYASRAYKLADAMLSEREKTN